MLVVRDREAGNIIERVSSVEEGLEVIRKFENQDIAEGIYEPDFYEVAEVEFILVGDSDKYGFKECLITLLGHDEEKAKAKFGQMMENPTDSMKEHSNFKMKMVKSKDAWWNDPYLSN